MTQNYGTVPVATQPQAGCSLAFLKQANRAANVQEPLESYSVDSLLTVGYENLTSWHGVMGQRSEQSFETHNLDLPI